MTAEEIEVLEDRELRIAVFEEILGYEKTRFNGRTWWRAPYGNLVTGDDLPLVDVEMSESWRIVESMNERDYALALEVTSARAQAFFRHYSADPDYIPKGYGIIADLAPRAICRAALWAVTAQAQVVV